MQGTGRATIRMHFVALTWVIAATFGMNVGAAYAVDYPVRTVTLVIPSPPGGGTDTQARILAQKLSEILEKPVIVENRPGASGNIGAQSVARAAPDGYTLLALISSHVINQYVLKNVPYDLDRDFVMISRTVTAPGVLIGNAALPATNLRELLTYLKASPGKVMYGSGGVGSLSHLIVELFEQNAAVKLQHVPYRGTQPAFTDVLSGQVSIMVPDLTIALGQLNSGKLRAYGVTSATRSTAAPDIPTLAEAGLAGFDAVQWFGLAAPAGTPPEIVNKLHAAVVRALNDPGVKERCAQIAMTPAPNQSPAEFAAFVREESARWGQVVKNAGIAAQ